MKVNYDFNFYLKQTHIEDQYATLQYLYKLYLITVDISTKSSLNLAMVHS